MMMKIVGYKLMYKERRQDSAHRKLSNKLSLRAHRERIERLIKFRTSTA